MKRYNTFTAAPISVSAAGGGQTDTLPGGGFHGGGQTDTLPGGGFHGDTANMSTPAKQNRSPQFAASPTAQVKEFLSGFA